MRLKGRDFPCMSLAALTTEPPPLSDLATTEPIVMDYYHLQPSLYLDSVLMLYILPI